MKSDFIKFLEAEKIKAECAGAFDAADVIEYLIKKWKEQN